MELLTILLSSLLGLVSPAGLVIDHTAENAIRSQFAHAEQLQVRVDNAPSYQLLQGRVERVLIAGRGLQLKQPGIRIAALELETDPIDLEPNSWQKQPKLKRPLQAGVRLVLTEQDVNQALQSLPVIANLGELGISIDQSDDDDDAKQRYNLVEPRVELLPNNRLRFQAQLQAKNNETRLAITVESGLGIIAGRQIQLIEPVVYVNREAVTNQLVSAIATNVSKRLDLRQLEQYGIQARILQLKVDPQKLEMAAFLRLEPAAKVWQNLNRKNS